MTALTYLAPPLSGLVALGLARTAVQRAHALQAIGFGTLWAVCLYAGSAVSPAAGRVVWAAGGIVWLGSVLTALVGRAYLVPVFSRWGREADLRPEATDEARSTSGR